MEIFSDCNTASLNPYVPTAENPWDASKINHLYRRMGFSASAQTVNTAQHQNPSNLVDSLIDQALNIPLLTAPAWAQWNDSNYSGDDDQVRDTKNTQVEEWALTVTRGMITNNLRDRLSFFWSNHFVTEYREYQCPAYLYQYYEVLQQYALGNFREFTREVGLTPAMLMYLDGGRNRRGAPNENYARELYELFTMGEGNGYTEQDILETARALTGYTDRPVDCGTISFDTSTFDPGSKTIFGRAGNWGYDDVIDILFDAHPRLIGTFICTRLYNFFVSPVTNEQIVDQLVDTFVNNDFEIAPVLRQLFKSEHFFNEETIGVVIKSHFDFFINFINETGLSYTDDTLSWMLNSCRLAGQQLFSPVDVAGWQRNRSWINSNSLILRWNMLDTLVTRAWEANQEQFRDFALAVAGDTNDFEFVVRSICGKLMAKELFSEAEMQVACDAFKGAMTDDHMTNGAWNLYNEHVPLQVFQLLIHLIRQPELQLK
ncbi:DUF1800 family protein [Leptobacterium flavescens]|uniref:DUF1800 family protein n=1 Tax=Leptobacterium flavescens TaxID=472055 RepID=A0A6P0UPX2_9FLAO|nr:DUF1800 domain-containing protein [Leptobacterium flavescens]NER12943.1 DUF1800 family protein [Leptobacterium flavescens]